MAKATSEGKVTIDHKTIRRWAEKRGGIPASVSHTTSDDDPGILRLDFEPRDKALDPIDWDAFFKKFDQEGLAFLYQDQTADGKLSRFHKFINRS